MIVTDYRFLTSDNPENDYKEFYDYLLFLKSPKANIYRHEGVPYIRVRRKHFKRILNDMSILKVTKREFIKRMEQQITEVESFGINPRYFASKNLKTFFLQMVKNDGFKKYTPALVKQTITLAKYHLEVRIIEIESDYHFIISNEHREGKCWVEKDNQEVKQIPIPENVVMIIKDNIRYLPKKEYLK